jgi:adenosylcobinamide kinase/adenosylcobinamide-phosphate guanylyltransferase
VKELILGGVRSGKSRLAERRAQESGLEVVYVATARVQGDAELGQRIQEHRARRPSAWRVVEEPLALAGTLRAEAGGERCLIVECLTLWLTNLLNAGDAGRVTSEREALLDLLPVLPGHIILVSNETGLGIVPLGALSRRFMDESGMLHQRLAGLCDRVILSVAGLPLTLKGTPYDLEP